MAAVVRCSGGFQRAMAVGKERLARLLCARPDDFVFVVRAGCKTMQRAAADRPTNRHRPSQENTSAAVNGVLRGTAWRHGDVVVVLDVVYPMGAARCGVQGTHTV